MSPSNFHILANAETPLGTICLRRRELLSEPGTTVTEITLDHECLMSSYDTESERALARGALDRCGGKGLDVLIGGLGLGYTAGEVLASDRTGRVEVVEFLPEVIQWHEEGLVPLAAELRSDPRFAVTRGDVYARLWEAPHRTHDLVLIDVDHAPDARLGDADDRFYTADGLARARKHVAPGGVLAIWSYAESSPFADALGEVFDDVEVEHVVVENRVIEARDESWLFFARR